MFVNFFSLWSVLSHLFLQFTKNINKSYVVSLSFHGVKHAKQMAHFDFDPQPAGTSKILVSVFWFCVFMVLQYLRYSCCIWINNQKVKKRKHFRNVLKIQFNMFAKEGYIYIYIYNRIRLNERITLHTYQYKPLPWES